MKKQRLYFIDYMKFLAVLLMIQGHTFRILLWEPARQQGWYRIHEFIHGVTAPAFMFAAGFVFYIVTRRHWPDMLRFGRSFWKRIRRTFDIIFLGYILHIQSLSLYRTLHLSTKRIGISLQTDVLQSIGVSLLALQILAFISRKRTIFLILTAISSFLIFYFATPVLSLNLPRTNFFTSYLSPQSLFPLFPYAGYVFSGVIFSFIFYKFKEKKKEILYFIIAGLLGVVFVLLGLFAPFHWRTRVIFSKFGLVLLLLIISRLFELIKNEKFRKYLVILGEESLFLYLSHLVILFGWCCFAGIFKIFGKHSQPLIITSLVFLGLLFVTVIMAYIWHFFKKRYPDVYNKFQYAWLGVFLILFFFTE